MMSASLPVLIKQGDPAVIATLMNHALRVHEVRVQVQRREDTLHILLEAEKPPTSQNAIPFICESWRLLELESIQTIMVYSRSIGDRLPTWQKRIERKRSSHAVQFSPSELQPIAQLILEPLPQTNPSTEIAPISLAHQAGTSIESAMTQAIELPLPESTSPDSAPQETPLSLAKQEFEPSDLEVRDVEVIEGEIIDTSTALDFPANPTELTPSDLMGSAFDNPDLFKRPEAVIFVMFCSLVLLWDTYLSVVDESTASPSHLSSGQLARRLQTSRRTIRRMKRLDRFSEWTQSLDPEGKAWVYRRGMYISKI